MKFIPINDIMLDHTSDLTCNYPISHKQEFRYDRLLDTDISIYDIYIGRGYIDVNVEYTLKNKLSAKLIPINIYDILIDFDLDFLKELIQYKYLQFHIFELFIPYELMINSIEEFRFYIENSIRIIIGIILDLPNNNKVSFFLDFQIFNNFKFKV